MSLSRRTFLRRGLGGSAILLAGGLGLSLQPTAQRTPQGRLQALSPKSYSILAAVADRMIPAAPGFLSAAQLQVPEQIDALLASLEPGVTKDVERALALVENGLVGLLLDRRPGAFTHLEPEQQDRVLATWRDSRWEFRRMVYQALHGLCMAVAYSSPEAYPSLGYPGPPPLGGASR